MNEKRLLTFVVLAMILAGCGTSGAATQPSDAGQPPATSTAQSPGDLSPLEWLSVAAFETAQDGLPDVLPAYSPEGFNALDPDHVSAEAPNGYVLHQSDTSSINPAWFSNSLSTVRSTLKTRSPWSSIHTTCWRGAQII